MMLNFFKINSEKKKLVFEDGLWLLFQHLFKFTISFFVTLYLARYLGPEDYGLFSLSISYILLFAILSDLGLPDIFIRDLVNLEKRDTIISTVFFLRILGGLLSLLILVFFIQLFPQSSMITISLIVLSPILFLKSFNSFANFFQSINKNKYLSIATIISIILGGILTLIFIWLQKKYFYFILVYLLEFVCLSFFLLIFYLSLNNKFNFKFDKIIAKRMLFESWPLIIAGASAVISTRIDQIFIGNMLSQNTLGNYAVAAKISEVWLVLPMIYGTVLYPVLIEKRRINFSNYRKIILITISLFLFFGLIGAAVISFLSEEIISFFFGDKYSLASTYLTYYIWSTLPYFSLFILSKIFYIEKIVKFGLIVSVSSILLNILLNFIFIKLYDAIGAIIATLIANCLVYLITFLILKLKTNFFEFKKITNE